MSILIHKDTTVIIQGITGREAVNMTRELLDYGTKVVGGVTPGRAGRDVYGVPVFGCVRDITAKQHVDGAIVTVPPAFTRDAVFEAMRASMLCMRAADTGRGSGRSTWRSWAVRLRRRSPA